MTGPALTLHRVLHMSLSRGGYAYGYEIRDAGNRYVGRKSVFCETRDAKQVTTYALGDSQFATAAEFLEAYNRKIETERRDQEWEAAAP
jgi:hypothetical protein